MLTVGITGGLATGKSLVTRLLEEQGAVVFSADQAARAVLSPHGQTLARISRSFGTDVLLPDGGLNRTLLGQRVFADTEQRETLNRILHPPIMRLLRAQMDACREDLPRNTVVVVEVPLLFETKMQMWFERIVVVTASLEVQVTRLKARNLLEEEDARRRIGAQMPLEYKAAQADYVIANEGFAPDIRQAVAALWRDLQIIRP